VKNIKLLSVKDERVFFEINVAIKNKIEYLYYYYDNYLKTPLEGKILLYTHFNKTLHFCEVVGITPTSQKNNYTKINKRYIFGNYEDRTFYKFKVISQIILKKKIYFPQTDKLYFLEKPIHDRIYAELISVTTGDIDIYNYISNDGNTDKGVIALKENNVWGFLYYERDDLGEYKFQFEEVDNYIYDKKLNPNNDGYKDFTYFIISHSLPKACKIGRAENPNHRLKQIQAHNSRDVEMQVILADGRLEAYYHNKFSHLRISSSREWFEVSEDLENVIEQEKSKIRYILSMYNKKKLKKLNL